MILGNPDMVRDMLDSGASSHINLQDTVGETPSMYAAYGLGAGNQVDVISWKLSIINN